MIEYVQVDHSDDRLAFLTILENSPSVAESAGGEEQAGRPYLIQEASQKEWEGVQKMAQLRTSLRHSSSS